MKDQELMFQAQLKDQEVMIKKQQVLLDMLLSESGLN